MVTGPVSLFTNGLGYTGIPNMIGSDVQLGLYKIVDHPAIARYRRPSLSPITVAYHCRLSLSSITVAHRPHHRLSPSPSPMPSLVSYSADQ